MIQLALVAAVHEQFESDALTVTLPVPPEADGEVLVGLMLKVQPDAWFTVNV